MKALLLIFGLFSLSAAAGNFSDFESWVHSLKAPNFAEIKDTNQRKKAFFDYLAPIVKIEQNKILALRYAIKYRLLPTSRLQKLARIYRIETQSTQALLDAIDIIPISLVLAQAALESGWGMSRFARPHNNFFGIWCFKKDCGVVPKNRDKDAKHEVAKFATPAQSIRYYLLNLNRKNTYKTLRQIRKIKRQRHQKISGLALSEGLIGYSTIGYKYVETIKKIIRNNNLTRYD